jgi:hypothetical protein
MTTKPTPEQARAYADALIAWSEGKKVEQRDASPASNWYPFDGEAYIDGAEYRIVPDPPKAREWFIPQHGGAHRILDGESLPENCVRARQILPTEIVVDKTEYEELRRNEAALKAASIAYLDSTGPSQPTLLTCLDREGARL